MRIACLQFAPQVGDIDNNLNRADAVLQRANPKNLDLLVLPELAFTGYNFKSLKHISPYLEPTAAGITSLWARTTALKYDCVVTVGYPEKVDITEKWPASPEYYNSAIVVSSDGETIANYRKSFLYYSDETWALEGPDGFFDGVIPGLGNVAIGICKWPTTDFERMDLNPYKFEAPWSAWEFSYHVLHKQANLVILTMAWLTRQDARTYSRKPKDPDMESLSYWLARLEPVIRAEEVGEIIVIIANRCGVEDDAVYAGTSCVLGIDSGEVKLYGVLGRGEKELLVVDTTATPQAKLVAEQTSKALESSAQSHEEPKFDPELSSRDKLVASIDAILSASNPVSPVEPHFAHSYYNSQPPKTEEILSRLRSSVATESRSSSHASTQSPSGSPGSLDPVIPTMPRLPALKSGTSANHQAIPRPISARSGTPSSTQPTPRPPSARSGTPSSAQPISRPPSARSQKPFRKESLPSPHKQFENLEGLEIIGIIDLKDRQDPDSASSMTTNTPWEANPSFFRAEDIKEIVKSNSPVIQSSSPTSATLIGSNIADSSLPAMKRPQSPKSRNTSRTRHLTNEQPTPVTVDQVIEPLVVIPVVLPPTPFEEDDPPVPTRQATAESGTGKLVPRNDPSLSFRPKSTGW